MLMKGITAFKEQRNDLELHKGPNQPYDIHLKERFLYFLYLFVCFCLCFCYLHFLVLFLLFSVYPHFFHLPLTMRIFPSASAHRRYPIRVLQTPFLTLLSFYNKSSLSNHLSFQFDYLTGKENYFHKEIAWKVLCRRVTFSRDLGMKMG